MVGEYSIPCSTKIDNSDAIGVLGIAGKFLVTFNKKKYVGQLFGNHDIYQITAGEAIPLETLSDFDGEFRIWLLDLLHSGRLYCSDTYDLSKSLQRQDDGGNDFVFNQTLLDAWQEKTGSLQGATKVITGHIGTFESSMGTTESFSVAIISRYSRRRLGTRYTRRGIDKDGYVANFVEMEQLVWLRKNPDSVTSFCQIRGSVPTFWKQTLDLAWKPKMEIANQSLPKVKAATQQHFDNLKASYGGPIVCLNLLNDSGFELPLTKAYQELVADLHDDAFQYEGFAVNRFCKKMNYGPIQTLMDRIHDRLDAMGFYSSIAGQVLRQNGTTRTSCLDSLDRTNMVATWIAKIKLGQQAAALIGSKEPVVLTPSDNFAMNNAYADAGDHISLIYSGTGHMKSDVVRTGKRQWIRGSIDDGWNSLSRYYLNNFQDGVKQDCLDTWNGIVPETHADSHMASKSVFRHIAGGNFWATASLFGKEHNISTPLAVACMFVKFLQPHSITGPASFFLAMVSTFWVLVLVKLFGVDRHLLINEPSRSINLLPS